MHSARLRRAAIFALAMSGSLPVFADTDLPIYPISQAPEIKDYSGFMVVNLASESDSATVQLSQFKTSKDTTYLKQGDPIRKLSENYRINLKGKTPGFYVVPMKAGLYHIERIDAPFYNLPYKLSLPNIPGWRISIVSNQASYIGLLTIEKERTVDTMSVSLISRFAADYQQLTTDHAAFFKAYPLRNGAGYEDHFAASFNGEALQGGL